MNGRGCSFGGLSFGFVVVLFWFGGVRGMFAGVAEFGGVGMWDEERWCVFRDENPWLDFARGI